MKEGREGVLALLLLFSLLVLLAAPFVGMTYISPASLLFPTGAGGLEEEIFWRIRAPRVCISFLGGAALAMGGMAFQAIFRNPLATPFTLGTAGGASLGAALYVRLGFAFTLLGVSGISLFAFLGALLSILLVYSLTGLRGSFSAATVLLAGVAVSFFFSSLIVFIQYLSDFTHSFRIVRWLMGSLQVRGFESVLDVLPFIVGGCAVVVYLTHELNLLAAGEEIAAGRGVEVRRTKLAIFFAVSLMVGGVVSVCGPIGFVGMMSPHICRLLVGPNHRRLAPATLLFGGAFLTLCDTLARTIIAPAEIPVGVVTALIGGPFFLWLLLGQGSEKGCF